MATTKTDATGWSHSFTMPGAVATGVAAAATVLSPHANSEASAMSQQQTVRSAAPTTSHGAPLVDKDYVAEQMLAHEKIYAARLETAEARTDGKFAQLLGKLDQIATNVTSLQAQVTALDGKVDGVDTHTRASKREIIIAIVATGLTVAALAWAGVQIFQSGLSLSMSAFQSGVDSRGGPDAEPA